MCTIFALFEKASGLEGVSAPGAGKQSSIHKEIRIYEQLFD